MINMVCLNVFINTTKIINKQELGIYGLELNNFFSKQSLKFIFNFRVSMLKGLIPDINSISIFNSWDSDVALI
ncbi:hypothetical protein ETSB_0150 [cyanobacterium endosymbiont of Epithemia turgida isolate EtSB Lake Yunoko]|nr:hypothetical protein ETSB_0150 [cyanobacterium endosymbiont of Epithemia turgida isolate EtSB Lake Yunoko]